MGVGQVARGSRCQAQRTPTSASILAGLWSLKNETLGGLAMPLTFTKDQIAPRPICWWALIIRGGTYQNSGDGTVRCRTDFK